VCVCVGYAECVRVSEADWITCANISIYFISATFDIFLSHLFMIGLSRNVIVSRPE